MSRPRPSGRRLALVASLAALVAAGPTSAWSRPAPDRPDAPTHGSVAAQLGVKIASAPGDEFAPGSSFTGTLEKPEKLEPFGIKGMLPGARVTVARVSPVAVIVEADQLEPTPARSSVRLRIDADGKLAASSKG